MYCGVPEEDPEQIVALVLAGGESRRMGQDKGMLERNGKKWIQHAAALCESLSLPVYYSVNAFQRNEYALHVPEKRIITDTVEIKGPLAGLFSFYSEHPHKDVLLLPCDMIRLQPVVLQTLLDEYQEVKVAHEVVVYHYADGTVEPMPGIYCSEAIRKLFWLYASGDLFSMSLKYAIGISNSYMMEIPAAFEHFFMNANSPGDINRF